MLGCNLTVQGRDWTYFVSESKYTSFCCWVILSILNLNEAEFWLFFSFFFDLFFKSALTFVTLSIKSGDFVFVLSADRGGLALMT